MVLFSVPHQIQISFSYIPRLGLLILVVAAALLKPLISIGMTAESAYATMGNNHKGAVPVQYRCPRARVTLLQTCPKCETTAFRHSLSSTLQEYKSHPYSPICPSSGTPVEQPDHPVAISACGYSKNIAIVLQSLD